MGGGGGGSCLGVAAGAPWIAATPSVVKPRSCEARLGLRRCGVQAPLTEGAAASCAKVLCKASVLQRLSGTRRPSTRTLAARPVKCRDPFQLLLAPLLHRTIERIL